MYDAVHTSFDVMKEFLITGSELTEEYQIPKIPPCQLDTLPEDSIDFEESFSRKIKNHRKLNVNFYIDDTKFTSKPGIWTPVKPILLSYCTPITLSSCMMSVRSSPIW